MVGRLIEQQHIGIGKQHGGQRHAHSPATGKIRTGALLGFFTESKPGQDRRSPGRGCVRVDIGQSGVDIGYATGIVGAFGFFKQLRALYIGGQDGIDKADRTRRGLLGDGADAGALPEADGTAIGVKFVHDQFKQRRFAGAVASDQSGLVACGQCDRGLIEQDASANAVSEVIYV